MTSEARPTDEERVRDALTTLMPSILRELESARSMEIYPIDGEYRRLMERQAAHAIGALVHVIETHESKKWPR